MQKWEYDRLQKNSWFEHREQIGEMGWELITVDDQYAYFKRPLVESISHEELRERHRAVEQDEIANARAERIRRQQGF